MIELGGATVRHKLDELAKLIVKNTKVQEVSNDPIPAKISLIPLYFMAMLKCSALRGGCDNRSDARCYVMQQLRQCSLDMMLRYLYPTMMSLSAISPQVHASFPINCRAAPSPRTWTPCPKTCVCTETAT